MKSAATRLAIICSALFAFGSFAGVASGATRVFGFTGAEQTFTVPAGVSSVHVTAVGGKGPVGGDGGGFGGIATANLHVSPGAVLYIEVGGNGSGTIGGFNGGGAGGGSGTPAGGGGGCVGRPNVTEQRGPDDRRLPADRGRWRWRRRLLPVRRPIPTNRIHRRRRRRYEWLARRRMRWLRWNPDDGRLERRSVGHRWQWWHRRRHGERGRRRRLVRGGAGAATVCIQGYAGGGGGGSGYLGPATSNGSFAVDSTGTPSITFRYTTPPPPISNNFRIKHASATKRGKITITAHSPGAGSYKASGKARVKRRNGTFKTINWGDGSASIRRAGDLKIKINPPQRQRTR